MSSTKKSPYNLSQLHAIASGNDEFIRKMIKMFLELTPELLDRVENGIKTENWSDVRSASHKMKPSLELMGIDSIYDLIRRIEHNAKTETNLEEMPDLSRTLKDILTVVFRNLEEDELGNTN